METINKGYVPTASASGKWLHTGTLALLGAFCAFIIMGILGEDFGVTADVRGFIIPLILLVFLGGTACVFYSKWIEQPGIKEGAVLVKRIVDEVVNPRYADSTHRIRWTVRVNVQKKSGLHMGQTFVERPVITVWALRSADDAGVLQDWTLPQALTRGGLVHTTAAEDGGKASPVAAAAAGAGGRGAGGKRKTAVKKVGAGKKTKPALAAAGH